MTAMTLHQSRDHKALVLRHIRQAKHRGDSWRATELSKVFAPILNLKLPRAPRRLKGGRHA
jgi:hypothetical protein